MDNARINELKKQYYKVYIDTIKHYVDIKKWIEKGSRKQGDIRRSLGRLTSKYDKLYELKIELEKNNIKEADILPYEKINGSLLQFKDKINDLYISAGLRKKETTLPKYTNVNLVSDIDQSEDNDIILRNKKARRRQKNGNKSKIKFFKRFVAVAMATIVASFSGVSAGEKTTKSDKPHNEKSYTDINHSNNEFKNSIYMQSIKNKETEEIISTTENQKQVKEMKENHELKNQKQVKKMKENRELKNKKQEEKKDTKSDKVFIAPSNMEYTEVSDGTGNKGHFVKDTKVKFYNKALIKENKDGTKEILATTKEKGNNYKKLKKNANKNVEEYVALQSEDGQSLYGWVSLESLEKDQDKQEIERD